MVHTKEGQADVSTKSRWLYVFPMPHTGVMPYPCSATELKQFGTFIKWTTDNPAALAKLHESIVRLVGEIGVSGLVGIANTWKMAAPMWRVAGLTGTGAEVMRGMVLEGDFHFPMPADVLEYLKGFR